MSEIARKHAYVRRSCPKGTTKATDRAFCRTRLLVTPTRVDVLCMICAPAAVACVRACLSPFDIKGCHATLVHTANVIENMEKAL